MPKLCALVMFLFFAGFPVSAQTPTPDLPEISFAVAMPRPHTHLLEVELHVKYAAGVQAPAEERLVMPVWTPGSYLIREFERHVQDFAVTNDSGQPLRWEKINKNTWRVVTAGSHDWKATYRVYANELSVRTNELNSDHAFWNNAALLMYLDGFLKAPSTLRVLAPQSWNVATGLPPVPGARNTFRAESFDILYDSPVEVSNFKTISFTVKGVPHRIVIDGEGNYNPERVRQDVQKIVATEVELMGGEIPYKDYTFILHLRSNGGGGLEHLNSTALGYPRFGFKIEQADRLNSAAPNPAASREAAYDDFLSLVAHEFFHLWNVKRIRPDALGPFDYTKENYTKLLWVAEGITDYYANVILRRAGLISEQDFLGGTAKAFRALQNTPGRLEQSAEEASFDSWIKYYRPDENSINSQVSYYDKGAILGMLLDLQIRKLSNGSRSLDDVMRNLYTEFFEKGRNYNPADFQRICETMAGSSLDAFFTRYVRGREELDYNDALSAAGLRLEMSRRSTETVEKPYFGADLVQEQDRLIVKRVYAGSPAYEQGLNAGDQILAVNNMRANKDFFDARLVEKKPGDLLTLTIFRSDDLSTLIIKLGERVQPAYRITQIDKPTPVQQRIYQSWLGETPTE
ncbi:MAG TPA: PDZ domain-containing protein [Pyrinomonadaceae bacterium]